MSSNNKKYLVTLIIIIIFLFLMSLSIVLLLKNNRNIVNEDDVILESDSNTIIIKSFLTVNDEYGKTINDNSSGYYGYLEFDIKNITNSKRDFQLYMVKSDININEINEDYVKIYLTDYSENSLLDSIYSFKSFANISDKPDSKLLYSGVLNSNGIKKYKLRVWISDNYVIQNNDEAFTFVISARAI